MKKFIKENKNLLYILLFSICGVLSYILTDNFPELFPQADLWFSYFSQLCLAYIASFIFYVLVSYIPTQRTKMKYQKVALRQLRLALVKHSVLFLEIYKSCIDDTPLNVSNHDSEVSIKKVMDEKFIEAIDVFDMRKQAPVNSATTWVEYIAEECDSFSRSIDDIISKYSFHLEDDIIELLADVRHSCFISFFLEEHGTSKIWTGKYWIRQMDIVQLIKYSPKPYPFGSHGDFNLVSDHINKLVEIIEYYNNSELDNNITVDLKIWEEDMYPEYGSGKIN